MVEAVGSLIWINASVGQARLTGRLTIAEQVLIGEERLTAEVIEIDSGVATLQIFESASGLRVGEPIYSTGRPLSVLLGPGLLGNVFDGIQRPLARLKQKNGIRIGRGTEMSSLDPEKQWTFNPQAAQGAELSGGALLGTVQETSIIEHRILVPPNISGTLTHIIAAGDYTITDEIARIQDKSGTEHSIKMAQHWPVRRPRPIKQRLDPSVPLITGQRVLDTFFPVAKGGSAAVPGPFGSGKTVLQHSLAKWADADIIVYVGCGERGNEMTEVLEDFPELVDPNTGQPLMRRTVLVANTSNMPVAAREASIYTGITIAEYYRDQGYHVALMADSTSRWAEALREVSGRLEEMPIEEGYPAYLPTRIAAFYERSGRVKTFSDEEGSLTLIGAVSPPGGDFSEPVTRHTQRFVRCWWALDRELANKRHYPAVSWLDSYSLYLDRITDWWKDIAGDWPDLRERAMQILQREDDLQQLVRLVGPDALADRQKWLLEGARLLREGFLQQNALHKIDTYAPAEKQVKLLRLFITVYEEVNERIKQGTALEDVQNTLNLTRLIRLKEEVPNDELEQIDRVHEETIQTIKQMEG